MSLTFGNFKQTIPSQILTRARDYVRKGQILDLSFDEENMLWDAQVEGTDLYDVHVDRAEDNTLTCSCTCPYDMGSYCKHIAAVLYAIEAAYPEYLGTSPRKKSATRQTKHDKLRQRLEMASREQVVAILLDLAQQDRELLNQLLIHLDAGKAKPADYRRVVKDALRSRRGDYGFLDYTGSIRAARKIQELLTQAARWCETDQPEKAVNIYQAVIDETVPLLSRADDSAGALGDCVTVAVEGLTETVERLGKSEQEPIFAFCLDRARQREFYQADGDWDLLTFAESLVDSPARRALFTSTLEDIEGALPKRGENAYFTSYTLEHLALLKLSLIDRFDGSDAAFTFLRANLHLDRVRMVLIERCMESGALDEATTLIQDGITTSQRQYLPGLTSQYQAMRVNLLKRTGNKTDLIDAARKLWLDRGDEETFAVLKQAVPAAEWTAFVDRLIRDTRRNSIQLAWLYAHENRWIDLLALVEDRDQGNWVLEAYREPLESRFPDRMAALYEKTVDYILSRAADRTTYKQVVIYLHQIRTIGQAARADAIARRIRQQYANRPALLDELRRL